MAESIIKKIVPGLNLELASSTLALSIFLVALFTFTANSLFSIIISIFRPFLPMSDLLFELIFILFVFAILFLDMGNESKQGTILYISWALFVPSALYFSRMDLLLAVGSPVNFGTLSSSLPSYAILLAGMALACGHLLLRTLNSLSKARANFLDRGGEAREVDAALSKNLAFETGIIAASTAIVLATVFLVPALEPTILGIMRSTEYSYIFLGVSSVIVLILIIIVYVWPKKTSEKR